MKFLKTLVFLFVLGFGLFGMAGGVKAADTWYFCIDRASTDARVSGSCFKVNSSITDLDRINNVMKSNCNNLYGVNVSDEIYKTHEGAEYCEQKRKEIEAKVKEAKAKAEAEAAALLKQTALDKARSASDSKIIPQCALENGKLTEACKDVTIFLYFAINIGRYLFGIVGSLTLVVLIYGGFMLILSQGNPEKVKKGTDALVGAVIGLVIVFSAYMLVRFTGQSIGLNPDLRLYEDTTLNTR